MAKVDAEQVLRDAQAIFARHFGDRGALLLVSEDKSAVEMLAVDPFNGYEFFFTLFAGETGLDIDAGYTNMGTRQSYYAPETHSEIKHMLSWLEGAMRKFHGDAPLAVEHLGGSDYEVLNPINGERGNFTYLERV